MRIITNQKLISRNKKIGQYTTILSVLVLGAGLYASFQQTLMNYTLAALILGFLLSQIGIFYITRWGRQPRPDEQINTALKGLDDKFSLYHYKTPVSHLLVGPAGLITITALHQPGKITYDEKKGKWLQKGGNLYMKIFGQEGLGRPDREVDATISEMKKFLSKNFEDFTLPDPQPVIFFMNDKADVQASNAPIPTLTSEKLKDFIRRKSKENIISQTIIEKIRERLPKPE